MSHNKKKIVIIPCSGIGKAFGTIGREASYMITEDFRPDDTETVCLSSITMHDGENIAKIQTNPVITIDGCPKVCAKVNVEKNNGKLHSSFNVFDAYRDNKHLKSMKISSIDENGLALASILAHMIIKQVDELKISEGTQ